MARSSSKWAGLLTGLVLLAGGYVVLTPLKVAAAACTAPSTDYGTVTQTVTIPSNATYRVWSRMMADSANAANDTYLLEIDGSNCYTGGGTGISTSAWTWADYQNGSTTTKINATLTAGNHTIKMIGNAANVQLDRIIFTADTSCVPSGTGDNCANPPDITPPTVSITSPTSGATVPSSTTVNVTAADDVAVSKVELRVDGTLVGTDTATPYSFNATLSVGTHSLVATAYDTSNNTTASSTVNVTVADTTPPTISAVASGGITQTTATITWTTNEAADSQVEYGATTAYGSNSALNTTKVTSHSVNLTGLTPGATYNYRVKSKDAANNQAVSTNNTFTTSPPSVDTTQPTVSVTAPAGGSTAKCSVSVTATASDNVGVAGVQFLLDGANLGSEDTSNPYSVTWNSFNSSNGTHTLSARARDAAGNTRTATNVTVTVSNRFEDINEDCKVDFIDLGMLLAKYGQTGITTRENISRSSGGSGDTTVDFIDLGILLAQYGK